MKAFENIPLAVVMIIISGITSFAVVSTKVSALEKTTDKSDKAIAEVVEFKAQQAIENKYIKEKLDETKSDLKEILKEIRSLK